MTMSNQPAGPVEQVAVNVMGREYLLACTPEEKPDLLACARHIDQKMCAIRDSGKVMGADRIAVLAALNLAFDLADKGNAVDTDAASNRAPATLAKGPTGSDAEESSVLGALLTRLDDVLSEDGRLL
jgi:cell division protein ZapA